jgi:hypothetical protein
VNAVFTRDPPCSGHDEKELAEPCLVQPDRTTRLEGEEVHARLAVSLRELQ